MGSDGPKSILVHPLISDPGSSGSYPPLADHQAIPPSLQPDRTLRRNCAPVRHPHSASITPTGNTDRYRGKPLPSRVASLRRIVDASRAAGNGGDAIGEVVQERGVATDKTDASLPRSAQELQTNARPAPLCSGHEYRSSETADLGSTSGVYSSFDGLSQRVVMSGVSILYSYLPVCPLRHDKVLNPRHLRLRWNNWQLPHCSWIVLKNLLGPQTLKVSFATSYKAAIPTSPENLTHRRSSS